LSNTNAIGLVANWWNEVATGVNGIFKKYAEHIAAHYKKWRKTQAKKEVIKNSHADVLFDALEATSVPASSSTHDPHNLVPPEREEHNGGADDNSIDFCRVLDDSVAQEETEGRPAAGPCDLTSRKKFKRCCQVAGCRSPNTCNGRGNCLLCPAYCQGVDSEAHYRSQLAPSHRRHSDAPRRSQLPPTHVPASLPHRGPYHHGSYHHQYDFHLPHHDSQTHIYYSAYPARPHFP
jgi:hypothetical protein